MFLLTLIPNEVTPCCTHRFPPSGCTPVNPPESPLQVRPVTSFRHIRLKSQLQFWKIGKVWEMGKAKIIIMSLAQALRKSCSWRQF